VVKKKLLKTVEHLQDT